MKAYILVIVIVLIVVGFVLFALFGSMIFNEGNESTENTTDGNAKVDKELQNTELKDNKPIETHDSGEDTSKLNEIVEKVLGEITRKDEKTIEMLNQYSVRLNGLKDFDQELEKLSKIADNINEEFKILHIKFEVAYALSDVDKANEIVEKLGVLEQQESALLEEIKRVVRDKNAEKQAIFNGIACIYLDELLTDFNNLLKDYDIEKIMLLYDVNESNADEIRAFLRNSKSRLKEKFKYVELKKLQVRDDHAVAVYSARMKTKSGRWIDVTRSSYFVDKEHGWVFDFEQEKKWLEARNLIEKLAEETDVLKLDVADYEKISAEKFISISDFLAGWEIDPAMFANLEYFNVDNFVIKFKPESKTELYIACIADKANKELSCGIVCYDAENDIWYDNYLYGSKDYMKVESEND